MRTRILSLILFLAIALSTTAQNHQARALHFSLISPLGTNGLSSHLITNRVSINLLGGYSYGNTAVEIASLYNVNLHMTKGLLLSGIINYSGRSYNSVQVAGVTNVAIDGAVGAQISGLVNVADNGFLQIGGVVNVAQKIDGVQIAGVINSASELHGVQIAGVGNISSEGAVAAQVGPIFNSAKRVKGVQIGLINYADHCDGVQIGLINIVKHGGKHEFELSFSEAINTALTFKLGTDKLYSIFSGGINYFTRNRPVEYVYGFGLGTHQNWRKNWGSQIEVLGYQLSEGGRFKGGLDMLTQFKFTVSKQFTNHFKIFVGPVLNMTISDYVDPQTGAIGNSLAPYPMWEQTRGNVKLRAWVGLTAGVRF